MFIIRKYEVNQQAPKKCNDPVDKMIGGDFNNHLSFHHIAARASGLRPSALASRPQALSICDMRRKNYFVEKQELFGKLKNAE